MTAITSTPRRENVPRENVLGVGVSAINTGDALGVVDGWIRSGDRQYVCITGVHGVMESWRSEALRRIHNQAGMVTPDGRPLAWLLRLGGHRDTAQVCGPDLMPALVAAGQDRGYRHFLYGAMPDTLERLQAGLLRVAPRAQIVGTLAPPFRPMTAQEDRDAILHINACRPDIVWVGLSTPKQEIWMAGHRDALTAPVLIGVGAAFDINAGLKQRAPRLVQRLGLEWAYRTAQEPRRLAGRYFRNNPAFLGLVLLQKAGLLNMPLTGDEGLDAGQRHA